MANPKSNLAIVIQKYAGFNAQGIIKNHMWPSADSFTSSDVKSIGARDFEKMLGFINSAKPPDALIGRIMRENPNAIDSRTLAVAAEKGRTNTVREMLKVKPELAKSPCPALGAALQVGQFAIAEMLLQADPQHALEREENSTAGTADANVQDGSLSDQGTNNTRESTAPEEVEAARIEPANVDHSTEDDFSILSELTVQDKAGRV